MSNATHFLLLLFPLIAFGSVDGILKNFETAKERNNKTPKTNNDLIGEKFTKCCKDNDISCPEVCTYPPPDFSLSEQWCVMSYLSDFIKCYAGGHNNTNCCENHGVVGIYADCRDYCDGTTEHSFKPTYFTCGPVKEIISKCNRDSIKQNVWP
uniref:Domain of unknown function DB domain-containing protein n=1 Tax=Globodera rostochiensis TaxID=31243 RepID=A0A914H5N3_GLORO